MAVEIKPVANQRGPLRVWEWPKPGNKYVIGIDTAEGVEGGDYSVGFVIEGRTKIHVATYHCSLDPVQFAPRCAALGYLYNRAHLAVERVNHGDAVLRELIHHLKYPEIYRAERAMTSERHATAAVRDFGIDPRAKKAIVVDDLRDAVSRLATIRDHLFYAEGLTWILDEKGRPETAEGAHDDVLMAAGCAFHARRSSCRRLMPRTPCSPSRITRGTGRTVAAYSRVARGRGDGTYRGVAPAPATRRRWAA